MKMMRLATLAALCLVLASCTSFRAWEKAQDYEKLGEWDKAVLQYEKALDVDPENIQYKMGLQRARLEASRVHFDKGQELMAAGHYEMAALEFQLTVRLDPTNQFAAVELSKAAAAMRERTDDQYRDIEEMKRRVTEQSKPPMLNPASNEPISLSFPKETNVKDIYRALGNAFGVNVMFDQRLTDDKISIELRDVTAQEALERVMQAATHFYKVLDEQTIIVIPDNAQTRREYEDLVIRTFYLSNGDAEQVTNVVRTMIEARNVFPLKALNAITIRDTADKVLIAERIIEANDKARAEVVVQVELLQVDTNRMRDIGLILGKDAIETGFFSDSAEGPKAITSMPWDDVGSLGTSNLFVNIPSATYKLLKTASEASLLARPQLRISEGETATLHIGQQVPIAVTTYNSIVNQPGQGGTIYAPPTSYQYRDVGIKISIEPRVHHNREVTLKLAVEVSNVQPGTGVAEQPIIGTRTIESTIRLKDGETNFLAGLIRKDENQGDTDIPFLSDLPVIGRLFSNTSKENRTTDLILTMTPHIIRIADITEDDLRPMWVGTSNNMTFRGLTPRMESRANGDPFSTPEASPQFQHRPAPGDDSPVPLVNPPRPVEEPPAPEEEPVPQSNKQSYDPFASSDEDRTALSAAARFAAEEDGDEPVVDRSGLTPRIAAQPSSMSLSPNDVAVWSLVGMDLDGLVTDEIILAYNPETIDVTALTFGSGLVVDPNLPPSIMIDREEGTITIRSETGPLHFRSGGEIAHVAFQAVLPGDTPLAISKLDLTRPDGRMIAATITGARATVDFD